MIRRTKAAWPVLLVALSSCTLGSEGMKENGSISLRDVIAKHQSEVMALPGVVGIAAGLCRDSEGTCVLVYIEGDSPPEGLPQELEGYSVEVHHTSKGFRPL